MKTDAIALQKRRKKSHKAFQWHCILMTTYISSCKTKQEYADQEKGQKPRLEEDTSSFKVLRLTN